MKSKLQIFRVSRYCWIFDLLQSVTCAQNCSSQFPTWL